MFVKSVPVVVVGLLVLAGCSGGGRPEANLSSVPAPSASAPISAPTSAAPSPSIPTTGANVLPGAHVPVMPSQAREHTAGGAAVFAANLIPAVDWAYSTTDSTILRQYYSSECNGCSESIAIFDSVRSQGHHYRGGHLTLQKLSSRSETAANAPVVVDVTVAQTELDVLGADGNVVESPDSPETALLEYSVEWSSDRWMVTQILAKKLK